MQRIHMVDIKVQSDGSELSHPIFGVRDQKKTRVACTDSCQGSGICWQL